MLTPHLTSDSDALARFEREAKAVAALTHPNILAIHDFGAHAGTAYAVAELLSGETLRARLATGALPVRKAPGAMLRLPSTISFRRSTREAIGIVGAGFPL